MEAGPHGRVSLHLKKPLVEHRSASCCLDRDRGAVAEEDGTV
jgi:hypothetical protein